MEIDLENGLKRYNAVRSTLTNKYVRKDKALTTVDK